MQTHDSIEYACPQCGAVVSSSGPRVEAPICYRCPDWPDMVARHVRTTDALLVSDDVPGRLRGLARMMATNGDVRT